MCSLRLWLLLWLLEVASSTLLSPVEQYEVVLPRRLPGPRPRRALSHMTHRPESVSYVLGVPGRTFTLHLRKNRDLVASGYTETYVTANGSQVTEQLQPQDHCYYQGHVEGYPESAASLSICVGLRGFFTVGSAMHLIEPLEGAGEEGPHALYQETQLQQVAGTCGVNASNLYHILGPRASAAFRSQSWPPSRETRYVELYMVTDYSEFQSLGTMGAVRSRVLEVVNHMDKLYQKLHMRVVLVGLEMWNSGDKIRVSSSAETTLENFLTWWQNQDRWHLYDSVQLITAVDFTGTTVGLAKVATMCSKYSGSVNQDHSRNPVGVAVTMAHEMGHNLGLDHDDNVPGCYCPETEEDRKCVMAASISSSFPKMFSYCSQTDLETFVAKEQAACLRNAPDPMRLVGGPKCGNGFLEHGEQCDCGPLQDCRNPCCNASTCQLVPGAECGQGTCCQNCRVKAAGELCRPAKDQCDLEEHCDGLGPECPEDAFQENGTPCPWGHCYNGDCPSVARMCQNLWGPGARVAMDKCYSLSIAPNCRGSFQGVDRADRCGVLFCEGGQKAPELASCIISLSSGTCQALYQDNGAYVSVPQGTRCGQNRVCWNRRCEDLLVYSSRNCSAKCNGHGVCNHKQQCHCSPGWAPPYCAHQLSGAQAVSRSFPMGAKVAVAVTLILLLALAVMVFFLRKRNSTSKRPMGLSNPLFHKGDSTPAKGKLPAHSMAHPEQISTTHSMQPSRPVAPKVIPKRPPPARPVPLPGPPCKVPVYSQQAQDQLISAPPMKPPTQLKPKQVVKPTSAPPMPPMKPAAGGAQGAMGPKVALKPPVGPR